MYCTNCGTEVADGAGFCTECGMPLSPENHGGSQAQMTASSEQKPNIGIYAAIGAVCLVMAIGIGTYFVSGQNAGTQAAQGATSSTARSTYSEQPSSQAASSAGSSVSSSDGGKKLGDDSGYSNTSVSSEAAYSAKANETHNAATTDEQTLTVEAADGSVLTGAVRKNPSGYVIPDSSSVEYSIGELRAMGLSDAELCIAWNEPFARQGYHFKNPGLRDYFSSCDWYTDTGNSASLTGVAAVNNSRLRQIAEEKESSKRWENLAAN